MRARVVLLLLLLLLLLVDCSDGASNDRGHDELLQIFDTDAQFRPGPFPAEDGGPPAIDLRTAVNDVVIGRLRTTFDGQLGPGSRAFVIGIDGVDGTWLLPAGIPDFESPDSPSATGTIGVRPEFPMGPFTLAIAGSDETGAFGAPAKAELIAVPEDPPAGELVIELAWEGNADLDLHVIESHAICARNCADFVDFPFEVPGSPSKATPPVASAASIASQPEASSSTVDVQCLCDAVPLVDGQIHDLELGWTL